MINGLPSAFTKDETMEPELVKPPLEISLPWRQPDKTKEKKETKSLTIVEDLHNKESPAEIDTGDAKHNLLEAKISIDTARQGFLGGVGSYLPTFFHRTIETGKLKSSSQEEIALDFFNKGRYLDAIEAFRKSVETNDDPIAVISCLEKEARCHYILGENEYSHILILSNISKVPKPEQISNDVILLKQERRSKITAFWKKDAQLIHKTLSFSLGIEYFDRFRFNCVKLLPEYSEDKSPTPTSHEILLKKTGTQVTAFWWSQDEISTTTLDMGNRPTFLQKFTTQKGVESRELKLINDIRSLCDCKPDQEYNCIFILYHDSPTPEKPSDIPPGTIIIKNTGWWINAITFWTEDNRILTKKIKISIPQKNILFPHPFKGYKVETGDFVNEIQRLFGCNTKNYTLRDPDLIAKITSHYNCNREYQKAIKCCETALGLVEIHMIAHENRVPMKVELLTLKSRVLIKLGMFNKAHEVLTKCLHLQPENQDIITALKEVADILNTERAADYTEIKQDPRKPNLLLRALADVHYDSARMCVAQKRYKDAFHHFNIALEQALENKENIWFSGTPLTDCILMDKAFIHQHFGHYASLLQCLEIILSRPSCSILLGHYGTLWAHRNKWTTFSGDRERRSRMLIALAYTELGDYQKALYSYDQCIKFYTSIIELSDSTHSTYLATIDADILKGHSEGQKIFIPDDWWVNKSFVFFCAGQLANAMMCVEKALEEESEDIYASENTYALCIKANILLCMGEQKESEVLYDQILKISNPDSYEHCLALSGKGSILYKSQPAAAKDCFQLIEKKVLSLPLIEQLRVHFIQGKLLLKQELPDLAQAAFEKALQLKPDYIPVLRLTSNLTEPLKPSLSLQTLRM